MRIKRNRSNVLILLILVLVWMAFIFSMSSDIASESNELSNKVTDIVIDNLENIAPSNDIDAKLLNHIIRKNAHVFMYFILALLVLVLLSLWGIRRHKLYIYTGVFCVLYAVSDEFHQLRVPGRGGQLIDVMIDSIGISVGLFMFYIVKRLLRGSKYKGD